MSERGLPLWAPGGKVPLAGELWLPPERPHAALLMVPGSGPSDRHNDVFFPPIREHLVANGIAVASFDKRGVGDSAGDWLTAGIVEQADDTLAALDALRHRGELNGVPVGIYGHSQGGWVVLEAAGRDPGIAFVVTSSGPGVSPADQERHAAVVGLQRAGLSRSDIEAALTDYEAMLHSIRGGASYEEFQQAIHGDAGRRQRLRWLSQAAFVPDGDGLWDFARLIIDYDPRPAMRQLRSPVLALFGAEDRSVPVEESVQTYRDLVRDVAVHVFADADHRCQLGDPPTMAPGYLDVLTGWLLQHSSSAAVVPDTA
jgi:pimeloyl-ACP methyl ester carboxylesterase